MNSLPAVAGAQTITRAIRALKLLAEGAPRGLRLVELAQALELERPTAHRLLKALMAEGMLVRDDTTRRYSLGPLVFELGLASAHQFNLSELCQPALMSLASKTGDTSFLFVRSGNDAVCLARVQGTYPIQTPAVPVGSRQPLGVSAGGLALFASLSDEEARRVLDAIAPRLSVYNHFDSEDLLQHRARAQAKGYAWIANHAVPGISAVGMPIRSRTGAAIAAVTVAATQARMSEKRVQDILPLLRESAEMIGGLLKQ
ncbi:IclR family transcriptional regulator [Noviherbaspirillum pedocola]|uniref:IclR family transcriptional regulator n=1 Tax=Noviherbaspirillum pedocola TaxID=2801341 RepID=A0A934W895_9BURK|nr:IclR family transcriptional regulator [Noviherbaspirillum pedocola]MBK4738357.1 IclR family transcriptional regulator [Noviherbaspirillum pedocola]